jgi:hypothetical protein
MRRSHSCSGVRRQELFDLALFPAINECLECCGQQHLIELFPAKYRQVPPSVSPSVSLTLLGSGIPETGTG